MHLFFYQKVEKGYYIFKNSKERVNNVSDILSVGQELEVKVLKVKDRIELSSN